MKLENTCRHVMHTGQAGRKEGGREGGTGGKYRVSQINMEVVCGSKPRTARLAGGWGSEAVGLFLSSSLLSAVPPSLHPFSPARCVLSSEARRSDNYWFTMDTVKTLQETFSK
ncbi:hypothetical protein E2C01_098506 [Portunus trituberculatus]|uniref:Uncharacterized protein n=1 Tax=Portunus trituberculatus TaxID=210409 RepID=A0A5B7K8K2_PORTR|nr:hypothetical protein [Portunus trituberculatus]